MITQEDVFTMNTSVILPPTLSLLNGPSLRVVIVGKGNPMLPEIIKNLFFSFHLPIVY
jgi:hypothetical protein